MNLTAIIPLLKLLKDAGAEVSPIGPPAPDVPEPENPTNVEFKPICGPGHYAQKLPNGLWSCLVIPKGR